MKNLFILDVKKVKSTITRVIDYDKLSELFNIDLKAENNTYSELQSTSINALASTQDYILIATKTKSVLLTRSSLTEKELLKKSENDENEKKQFDELRKMIVEASTDSENKLSIIEQLIEQFSHSIAENAIKQNYTKKIRIAVFNEKVTDKHVEYLKQYCFSYALHFISFTEKTHVKQYKDNYLSHVISIAK